MCAASFRASGAVGHDGGHEWDQRLADLPCRGVSELRGVHCGPRACRSSCQANAEVASRSGRHRFLDRCRTACPRSSATREPGASGGAGEKATVPAGVPHSVRNSSDEPAGIVNIHRPAQHFESFFRDMHTLIHEGKIKQLPPKDPRSANYAAMLFGKYPDEIRATKPPNQVFQALAFSGGALRFKIWRSVTAARCLRANRQPRRGVEATKERGCRRQSAHR